MTMENNIHLENQGTQDDAKDLSPIDSKMLGIVEEITSAKNFITDLQKLPKNERRLADIAKEQERIDSLQKAKDALLDKKFLAKDNSADVWQDSSDVSSKKGMAKGTTY